MNCPAASGQEGKTSAAGGLRRATDHRPQAACSGTDARMLAGSAAQRVQQIISASMYVAVQLAARGRRGRADMGPSLATLDTRTHGHTGIEASAAVPGTHRHGRWQCQIR